MKCSLAICNFLEESSSLSHPTVFLYFFALITEEGFLISPCYSLKLCIQMDISFLLLLCLLLLYFSQLFVRPPQTIILPFCISFSWGWSWSLPPVQCHKPPTVLLGLLLCFWMWGIFSGGIQHSPVDGCWAASCNFGVLAGEDEHTSFSSAILIMLFFLLLRNRN